MQTLSEYVTDRNASTFLRPEYPGTTSAERASEALYLAIGALDRLRMNPKNADKDGACVRLRELVQKLTRVKDELDAAIDEAERTISVNA